MRTVTRFEKIDLSLDRTRYLPLVHEVDVIAMSYQDKRLTALFRLFVLRTSQKQFQESGITLSTLKTSSPFTQPEQLDQYNWKRACMCGHHQRIFKVPGNSILDHSLTANKVQCLLTARRCENTETIILLSPKQLPAGCRWYYQFVFRNVVVFINNYTG